MPAEKRKIIERREVVVSLPVLKAPGWLQGFVNFVREQGVVGLAVGLTLGLAAKGLVDSLVLNMINPIAGIFYGGGGQLVDKYWCLKTVGNACSSKLGYGAVISQIINFVIVAGVVYLVIIGLKLDKLDKKKEE